jgi:hypothetical protein
VPILFAIVMFGVALAAYHAFHVAHRTLSQRVG